MQVCVRVSDPGGRAGFAARCPAVGSAPHGCPWAPGAKRRVTSGLLHDPQRHPGRPVGRSARASSSSTRAPVWLVRVTRLQRAKCGLTLRNLNIPEVFFQLCGSVLPFRFILFAPFLASSLLSPFWPCHPAQEPVLPLPFEGSILT